MFTFSSAIEHPLENPLILVAEREDYVRSGTCDVLKADGYDVIEAKDGPEAVEMTRTHRPAIFLQRSFLNLMDLSVGWFPSLRHLSPEIVILSFGADDGWWNIEVFSDWFIHIIYDKADLLEWIALAVVFPRHLWNIHRLNYTTMQVSFMEQYGRTRNRVIKGLSLNEVLNGAYNTDKTAHDYVTGLFKSQVSRIVVAAVTVIRHISRPPAVRHVLPLLDHADSNVRAQAVIMLGRTGYEDSAMLLNSLRSDTAEWRLAAAIEAAGNARSVKSLVSMLENDAYTDVAEAIVKVLQKIGSPEAVSSVTSWQRNHTPKN
jgi:hypothetical protein